jgi:predicted site-specific integrase-resolvase
LKKIELLREREAADILKLSPKTLSRWRWAGKGPVFRKIGGAVRYDLADIHQFAAG